MKTNPLNLRPLVQAMERSTGMLSGWPNPAEFPHVVYCPGLCPSMGYNRFRRTYHAVRAAAVQLAPCRFIAQAVHVDGERTGYEFRFVRKWDAARFTLCLRAVMAGRSSPLVDVAAR